MQNEKDKNLELQRLYEDQRVQNRNCMKELSEREQMLEKIEFLNQVVEEKEQELLLIRGDIPKKERFFEETVKNLKNNYESKIKNLENELENYAQQNEALHLQNQVFFLKNISFN